MDILALHAQIEYANEKMNKLECENIRLRRNIDEARNIIDGETNCLREFMKSVGGEFPMLTEKLLEVKKFLEDTK